MGKKNNIARVITALIICILTVASGVDVMAQTAGDFSISAILPENQVDDSNTYFDLRMEPGAKQTVQFVIYNSRPEALRANVQLNSASTGRNGLITYSNPDIRDEAMSVSINDVATIKEKTITVPAGGSTKVDIEIKMPDKKLEGVLLGGIVVSDDTAQESTDITEGVALTNIITYVLGLKLTQDDAEVAPDFDLVDVSPDLVNYKTAVVSKLRNKAPLIVKNMKLNAKVYGPDPDTPIRELSLDSVDMAPQSTGDFVIDWENEAFSSGTYRLAMTGTYRGEEWNWDQEFTISGEANTLNSRAVDLVENFNGLYIALGIIILILIGCLVFWLGRRRRWSS